MKVIKLGEFPSARRFVVELACDARVSRPYLVVSLQTFGWFGGCVTAFKRRLVLEILRILRESKLDLVALDHLFFCLERNGIIYRRKEALQYTSRIRNIWQIL